MSMNATPGAQRVRIGIFGRRNAGKSSLINALTGQETAVVSPVMGTTTDPVRKAMELLPLGPVTLIDTPGLDDEGELGAQRVRRAMQELRRTDIALIAVDAQRGWGQEERGLLERVRRLGIPYLVAYNKCDAGGGALPEGIAPRTVRVSARTGQGIEELKNRIAGLKPEDSGRKLIADLLAPHDLVVLVTPIDASAPKGRLILPQQQVIRDALEAGALPVVTRETELSAALRALGRPPRMVVTDSQVFGFVAERTPQDVPLTSFSILMARYKGYLDAALRSIPAVESLKDGDTVLIAEGCTHHRQCEDIGTVKIPRWLRAHCGREIRIDTCSGAQFPEDLRPYRLVIHCGGCMLSEREVLYRLSEAERQGVPFINYGLLIAHMQGILARATRVFDPAVAARN